MNTDDDYYAVAPVASTSRSDNEVGSQFYTSNNVIRASRWQKVLENREKTLEVLTDYSVKDSSETVDDSESQCESNSP